MSMICLPIGDMFKSKAYVVGFMNEIELSVSDLVNSDCVAFGASNYGETKSTDNSN